MRRPTVDNPSIRVSTNQFLHFQHNDKKDVPDDQKHLVQGIYLDYHYKDDQYFTDNFINHGFFASLNQICECDMWVDKCLSPRAVLPFTPSLMFGIHMAANKVLDYYDVSFITEQMQKSSNCNILYSITSSDTVKNECYAYGLKIDRKVKSDNCILTNDFDSLCQFASSISRPDEDNTLDPVVTTLAQMKNIHFKYMRFILLESKSTDSKDNLNSGDNYLAPLISNFSSCRLCSKYNLSHLSPSINIISSHVDLKSTCFHNKNGDMILGMAKHIISRLIFSPINSLHGIFVVGVQTRFKW